MPPHRPWCPIPKHCQRGGDAPFNVGVGCTRNLNCGGVRVHGLKPRPERNISNIHRVAETFNETREANRPHMAQP